MRGLIVKDMLVMRKTLRTYAVFLLFYLVMSALDLFPISMNLGKHNLLIYRANHILEQYLRLKHWKNDLVREKVYFGGNRTQIAWDFGRLLSYPEEAIRRLIRENSEKELV